MKLLLLALGADLRHAELSGVDSQGEWKAALRQTPLDQLRLAAGRIVPADSDLPLPRSRLVRSTRTWNDQRKAEVRALYEQRVLGKGPVVAE